MLPIIPIITKEMMLNACSWGQYDLANYTITAEKEETPTELKYCIKVWNKADEVVGCFNYTGLPYTFVDQAIEDVKDSILLAELGNAPDNPSRQGLIDLNELLSEQHEQF